MPPWSSKTFEVIKSDMNKQSSKEDKTMQTLKEFAVKKSEKNQKQMLQFLWRQKMCQFSP